MLTAKTYVAAISCIACCALFEAGAAWGCETASQPQEDVDVTRHPLATYYETKKLDEALAVGGYQAALVLIRANAGLHQAPPARSTAATDLSGVARRGDEIIEVRFLNDELVTAAVFIVNPRTGDVATLCLSLDNCKKK